MSFHNGVGRRTLLIGILYKDLSALVFVVLWYHSSLSDRFRAFKRKVLTELFLSLQ